MSGPALPLATRPVPRLRAGSVGLVLVLLLAAGLRLYDVGTTSLWTDELFTRFYPQARAALPVGRGNAARAEPAALLQPDLAMGARGRRQRVRAAAAQPARLAAVARAGYAARDRAVRAAGERAVRWPAAGALGHQHRLRAGGAALRAAGRGAGAGACSALPACCGDRVTWAALATYAVGATLAIYLHLTSVLAVAAFGLAGLGSALGRQRLLDRAGLAAVRRRQRGRSRWPACRCCR